jgi:tetratricopeptide (TPR) repeat protein
LSERYPTSPEAAEAKWLLGQLNEQQQRFAEAIRIWAMIPTNHARHDAAWAAIARCHERLIAQLRIEMKPTVDAEEAAIGQLSLKVRDFFDATGKFKSPSTKLKSQEHKTQNDKSENLKPEIPLAETDDVDLNSEVSKAKSQASDRLSRHQSELFVRLARLLIERQPHAAKSPRPQKQEEADDFTADLLLDTALAFSRDAEWRKTAGQLRVISLAGQRKIDAAEKLLDSLEHGKPDELLAMLDGLTAVSARCDASTQRLVAELQLRTLQELALSAQPELNATQRSRLWRARAEAYAATGQVSKAIFASEQLLEKFPRDPKLLRSTAELCELLETNAGHKQAKGLWRRLEALLKAGSPDWLETRWHVIRCCQKLGDQEEADKLLKVTKLLYPDLGGTQIKAKFDGL